MSDQVTAVPAFETYPPVGELVRPVPGVEYLFVPAQEVNEAQRHGWKPLIRPVYFDIQQQPFTILARGERVDGTSAESCQPMVHSTETGDALIGYVRKSDAEVQAKDEGPNPKGKGQGREGDAGAQKGQAA
jgi:hypothetical protein